LNKRGKEEHRDEGKEKRGQSREKVVAKKNDVKKRVKRKHGGV